MCGLGSHSARPASSSFFPICASVFHAPTDTQQIRAALDYVVGEHVGGARSSESETRLIDMVAQALVGEEELAYPAKVGSCSILMVMRRDCCDVLCHSVKSPCGNAMRDVASTMSARRWG